MPVEKKDYVPSIYRLLASQKSTEEDINDLIEEYQDEYADAVNDMAAWDFAQRGITGEKESNK